MQIPPQRRISWLGDLCMMPLMYLLQGTLREVPQRTHLWNNTKFGLSELQHLHHSALVTVAGDPRAVRRWWGPLPIFHIPLLGGWSKFSVIAPVGDVSVWYIGWIAGDVAGVSQIPLSSPVRVLVGPGPAQFFGVDASGAQIALEIIGHGRIGAAGAFAHIPLL